MLDRSYLRDHTDEYRTALRNRRSDAPLDSFLSLDRERRDILQEVEKLRAERNTVSQEIARLKKEKQDAQDRIEAMREVGGRIKELETRLTVVDEEMAQVELSLPNPPHETVPIGEDESANRLERSWGTPRTFDFEPKAHWELGESLGIIDFDRAAKITGARFAVMRGPGARLERALLQFMLDLHTSEHGYLEVLPPFIVNADSLLGTGQLPKFKEDLFELKGEREYFLIPTAEVPVTNLHRDEIIDASDLPISYCAYTPCFRSEAGSYGKDTRGLIRQHQFDKVELVKFVRPEESWDALEALTSHAEEVLRRLDLPYRVMCLSSGDVSFSSAKTYDLEVWLPGQNTYREISSCSNFVDFQARRANIRYRPEEKKVSYVHTLNGSGLAVGRTLVAILENYQESDGTIMIPEALRPYMGGLQTIS